MMKQLLMAVGLLALAGSGLVLSTDAPAQTYSGAYSGELFSQLQWRPIGPLRGGRARAVSGVPSQPNVFYFGADNGGVWESTDYGASWQPIADDLPTGSIGALAVAYSNPEVIYVGTGEGNVRPDQSTGMGVYKSTDAGKTWSFSGLKATGNISQLAVDPHHPDRVFVAALGHIYGPNAERGIFRSLDGGKTWSKVLYRDEYTSGDDVEIDPQDPNIVYASLWQQQNAPWANGAFGGTSGGIFKSADGGTTWKQLTDGLPAVIQAQVRVAPSNPQILYASVASKGTVGIYRSDDAGASWHKTTDDPRPAARIGGGDLPVPTIDPKNPDILYSASQALWKSVDGGKTWNGLYGAPGGDDPQQLWINPNAPDIMVLASDQGTIVSSNGGRSWSSWYNQPTAAMYKVGITNTWPYKVCGGQQDSGSACVPVRGNDGQLTAHDWHPAGIEEYGGAAPDPLHPNLVYGGKVTVYDSDTGQIADVGPQALRGGDYRVLRTMPLLFSPLDPKRLYFAANTVWQTDDGGQHWSRISPDLTRKTWSAPANVGKYRDTAAAKPTQRGVVYALAPSPLDQRLLWAGTDDGLIWVTHDGGAHWDNVTPPLLKPWWRVFSMEASHFNPDEAYAAVNTMWLDDMHPHLLRTEDGGKHWTEIDQGITADAASNVIRQDPVRKGLLYAGTETQAWVSFDNGDHWQSLKLNMPAISVRDLMVHGDDLVAATHGRGFYVLDDITPLRQIDATVAKAPATLYKPETAVRVRWGMNPPTPWRLPALPNPPPGAIIDYYLAADAGGAVSMDITGADGKLVRHFSTAEMQQTLDPKTAWYPAFWIRPAMNLSTASGMHRFVWDLHYQPVPVAPHQYDFKIMALDFDQAVKHDTPLLARSPWVMPGTYTVTLTVNGKHYTQPLVVKMDPRVKTSSADLQQQFAASAQAYQASLGVTRTLGQVRDLQQQVAAREAGLKKTGGKLADYAKELAALAGPESSSPFGFFRAANQPPTLRSVGDTMLALMSRMQNADRAPTAADLAALRKTDIELQQLMSEWNKLKGQPLVDVNRVLGQAHRPPLAVKAAVAPLDWDAGRITTGVGEEAR